MSFDPQNIEVYRQFQSYQFESNPEYLQGLEAVLQQYMLMQGEKDPQIKKDLDAGRLDESKIKPEHRQQLELQAKVYFFCKQTGNILDLEDYARWEEQSAKSDPPYSSNYEQLVDMIVNNKPIPNIKKIPDTVLDPKTASKHVLKSRRKPWEKEEEENAVESSEEKTESKTEGEEGDSKPEEAEKIQETQL